MRLKQALQRLEKDSTFREWEKKHKNYCLAHCFVMLDDLNKHIWQIGYYSKDKDKITTFVIQPDSIQIAEDADVFRKPGTKIRPVDMEKVNIDIDKAIEIADTCQRENYKGNDPSKAVIILQNLDDYGQVFNITFVTQTMKTLNFKISSDKGKLLKHECVELFSMDKGSPLTS
ncbi:hypothetical protein GF351_03935 [Candidatus Woesearchaeota archaeon]|nr:hypothetical protein [Candidatus Woesearchaeota archaeon]